METEKEFTKEDASILNQFPLPFDLGPETFQLVLKGLIWPSELADQLWELTKAAEEPSIQIEVLNDINFEIYSDRYAVNKSSTKISGPQFIKDSGFDGGEGPDEIDGGDGDDIITGGLGADEIDGGDNDTHPTGKDSLPIPAVTHRQP